MSRDLDEDREVALLTVDVVRLLLGKRVHVVMSALTRAMAVVISHRERLPVDPVSIERFGLALAKAVIAVTNQAVDEQRAATARKSRPS